MSIVDGVGLIEWEGGLFTPDSALLPRVRWAFAQIRAAGGTITLNEAGRPYGVQGDANVRSSSDTTSGRSTVWYQWGRFLRGETPSAANPSYGPYASEHTQGIAIDCNASQSALRARYFGMVGLSNTIASESWHWAIRGGIADGVDLTDYQWAGSNTTPFETPEQAEERELMSAQDNILKAILGAQKSAEAGRPLKLMGVTIPASGDKGALNGWVWVDEDGDWVVCPSPAYAILIATWGYSQSEPLRLVTDRAEWEFVTGKLGELNPRPSTAKAGVLANAIVAAKLSPNQVLESIAAASDVPAVVSA